MISLNGRQGVLSPWEPLRIYYLRNRRPFA